MADPQALALRAKMLGAMIREARLSGGRSLKDAASLLGVSTSTFSSYEHGRKAISLPELELLAFHLDVPLRRFWSSSRPGVERRADFDPCVVISLRNRMIGALLRSHRREAGMTIRQLAQTVGMPTGRISAYERGERKTPLPDLEALAAALGRDLEDYVDAQGPLGEWDASKRAFENLLELPADLREFLCQPANQPYLRLAKRLSDIEVERLRSLAEELLDVTQ
jgi:transcriptional regulator with XRE-family HTH domain